MCSLRTFSGALPTTPRLARRSEPFIIDHRIAATSIRFATEDALSRSGCPTLTTACIIGLGCKQTGVAMRRHTCGSPLSGVAASNRFTKARPLKSDRGAFPSQNRTVASFRQASPHIDPVVSCRVVSCRVVSVRVLPHTGRVDDRM
jgi:hypothetical protein